MTDFGIDVSTFPDLNPNFTLVTGNRAVGEAVARRLINPRGSREYDPNYGYDLRDYLNEGLTSAQFFAISTEIERECLKDERVMRAAADVSLNTATRAMVIKLKLATAAGPFGLTMTIDQVGLQTLVFR